MCSVSNSLCSYTQILSQRTVMVCHFMCHYWPMSADLSVTLQQVGFRKQKAVLLIHTEGLIMIFWIPVAESKNLVSFFFFFFNKTCIMIYRLCILLSLVIVIFFKFKSCTTTLRNVREGWWFGTAPLNNLAGGISWRSYPFWYNDD